MIKEPSIYKHEHKILILTVLLVVINEGSCEYDQEMPQSYTPDQPTMRKGQRTITAS